MGWRGVCSWNDGLGYGKHLDSPFSLEDVVLSGSHGDFENDRIPIRRLHSGVGTGAAAVFHSHQRADWSSFCSAGRHFPITNVGEDRAPKVLRTETGQKNATHATIIFP